MDELHWYDDGDEEYEDKDFEYFSDKYCNDNEDNDGDK